MRLALDTSVLIAALVEPHPFHARAMPWLDEVASGRVEGECAWHALAETWAVLTRLPLEPPISPAVAAVALDRLCERVEPVESTGEVYRTALRRCADRGLRSGAIFDAIHLVTAENRQATALVTFNPGDFVRLRVDASPPVVVPLEPPAFLMPSG